MLSMGWTFLIFTFALLCAGVAFTLLWFRQAGARVRGARVEREEPNRGWRRL